METRTAWRCFVARLDLAAHSTPNRARKLRSRVAHSAVCCVCSRMRLPHLEDIYFPVGRSCTRRNKTQRTAARQRHRSTAVLYNAAAAAVLRVRGTLNREQENGKERKNENIHVKCPNFMRSLSEILHYTCGEIYRRQSEL